MFCTKCGKKIQDDAKFCPYCGATVEPVVDQSQQHSPERRQTSVTRPTNSPPPTSPKKSKKGFWGALVVILAILGLLYTIGTGNQQGKKMNTTPAPAATTQKQQAAQKKPAPGSIEFFEVDKDAIGQPVAFIQLKNDSDKTVDGFKVILSAKDNFGAEVKQFGYGDPVMKLMSQRTVGPHEVSTTDHYWHLFGFENGTKFHVKLHEIHYTDGTSWKAEESEPVEADTTKTDKVVQ